MPQQYDRRSFLQGLTASVGVAGLSALTGCGSDNNEPLQFAQAGPVNQPGGTTARSQASFNFRVNAAQSALAQAPVTHQNNGDETLFPNGIATFTKTLPHNAIGEPDPAALAAYLAASAASTFQAFETVPAGGQDRLANPVAGLGFDLQGPDAQAVTMPPAPTFSSQETAAEMVELYWMALLRDVPFLNYAADPNVAAAVAELNGLTDFFGPKANGAVTTGALFRGILNGDLIGPYISQFLLQDIPWGANTVAQLIQVGAPGVDYMTTLNSYLTIQNGGAPVAQVFDPTRRYIRNLRDLASYVHVDAVHQAFLQAALILLGQGTPLDPGLPASTRQGQFVNYGAAHILTLVTEVATRALKAVWYQKWNVHRRLRPEAYGCRVHIHLSGQSNYPIAGQLLNSQAVARTFTQFGTRLLPQAFPEGSPTHPSYGAGHAVIAAACGTVLKAFFNGTALVANPVEANPTGTALTAVGTNLTVEGELNKLVSNMSVGRNGAGVHFLTDYSNCIRLGELVAIGILREMKLGLPEAANFAFNQFDGTPLVL